MEQENAMEVDTYREENPQSLVVHAQDTRIILHEDKKYYPSIDEVYPGVNTVTLDEDAQALEEPLIKPIKVKCFSVLEKEVPTLTYSVEFMMTLMQTPALIRKHIHHILLVAL